MYRSLFSSKPHVFAVISVDPEVSRASQSIAVSPSTCDLGVKSWYCPVSPSAQKKFSGFFISFLKVSSCSQKHRSRMFSASL